MVPANEIREVAAQESVDVVGCRAHYSSLDEMVHVAAEMQRWEWTSRSSSGVRPRASSTPRSRLILRARLQWSTWDASRPLVSGPAQQGQPLGLSDGIASEYAVESVKPVQAGLACRLQRRANRLMLDFSPTPPASRRASHRAVRARASAVHRLDAILPDLAVEGQLPKILDHPEMGESARRLFEQANASGWAERKHFIRPRAVVDSSQRMPSAMTFTSRTTSNGSPQSYRRSVSEIPKSSSHEHRALRLHRTRRYPRLIGALLS